MKLNGIEHTPFRKCGGANKHQPTNFFVRPTIEVQKAKAPQPKQAITW